MKALAFFNKAWRSSWIYDCHLDGCLGFAVYRQDLTAGAEAALPAMTRFAATAEGR